jgi:hypothetical protein
MKVTPFTVVAGTPDGPRLNAPTRVPAVITSVSPERVVGVPHEIVPALACANAPRSVAAAAIVHTERFIERTFLIPYRAWISVLACLCAVDYKREICAAMRFMSMIFDPFSGRLYIVERWIPGVKLRVREHISGNIVPPEQARGRPANTPD